MSLLHSEQFSGWARGHLLCRFEDVSDRFALTFDDGPNGRATAALLDVLRRHSARATFFVLGGNVRRHPELVHRMVLEGHETGVHGDIHWPLPLLPPWAIRAEVLRSASCGAGRRARARPPPRRPHAPPASRTA